MYYYYKCVIYTVKPAFAANSHDRPPDLSGHISRDGTVPCINHLPWPATCECRPPATYLCQNYHISPLVAAILETKDSWES